MNVVDAEPTGWQHPPGIVHWRVHFSSSPETVFDALNTQEGRESYWADAAPEEDEQIVFSIGRYPPSCAPILKRQKPFHFAIRYFGTRVDFELRPDGKGGADLELTAREVPHDQHEEFAAGWVSVLLNMKAAVDFGVDLRNRDVSRTWLDGYVDN